MSKKRPDTLLDEAIATLRASVGDARKESGGGEKLGRQPDKDAPLHVLYAPLTDETRRQGEERLGRPIPDAYAAWLQRSNGGWFYAGELSFSGVRPDTTDVDHGFDLDDPNVYERPADAADDDFFFGFYNEDGSHLYVDGDGAVHRAERDRVEPLQTWPSVAEAIHGEITRLVELLGDGLDESVRTLPD